MEDTNQSPQAPTEPSASSSSLDRRPSVDDDSSAMTIEFLRARLLSERSVSKAARQRAQQLSKKISELEERLEAELRLRKKLEADRVEILSKYRSELSEEFGEFFASTFGEGRTRNESHMPNEEEEGVSSSRAQHLNKSDSSQCLNHDEANDEDEENDQLGREKGVLSWGRQKGLRKEFGHGFDWLGRSLSQRSLASTDGESPQKKWAGKSVRQIRKKEPSNAEGEPGQFQALEDFDGKSGQPDDMKDRLQCEDERDTEVERVLERQAELIEQFEAEENAQRAWEAKFEEAKALANHETGINQSNSSSTLETMARNMESLSLPKDGATEGIETESTINEDATRYSRKVHPEDCSSRPVQSKPFQRGASEYTSGVGSDKSKTVQTAAVDNETCSASREHILLEGKPAFVESTKRVEGPDETLTEKNSPDKDERLNAEESSCSVSKEDLSQDQVLSNTDTEQGVDHSNVPATELRKSRKYMKHQSSSFKFTVFADAELVASSSPQMSGFAVYKQEASRVEDAEAQKEEALASGPTAASEKMSGFGSSEPHLDECNVAATASSDHHRSVDHRLVCKVSTFPTMDTQSHEKSKDTVHDAIHEREHLAGENGVVDPSSSLDPGNGNERISDSNREEASVKTSGLGGDRDPGGHYSDLSSYPEFRGQGVAGLQPGLGRHYSNFQSHLQSTSQQSQMASMESEGANFGNFSSLPGNRSGVPGPALKHANVHEDTALRDQHRSIDGGFDRVMDVLRVLQIAKYQIESSSDEQETPFAIDTPYRNGYDGRDGYYVEPPRHPSVYTAPPQYTPPVPYSSRGMPPFSQNIQGWGAMQSSYGGSSSRQLAHASYNHYASRVPEPQGLWHPPPSQGLHESNPDHYYTRQYR